ncbi:MAG: inositol monophosphatase family protein [Eubacteriales bacterium]
MNGSYYKEELGFIVSAMREAYSREFLSGMSYVTEKSEFDVVSRADVAIERAIGNAIKEKYPLDRIHGEETSPSSAISGRTWIIDPIDGTFNMSRGIDSYGMQCALSDCGRIVAGVIFLPLRDELYTAEYGCGAYLNGKRIGVTPREMRASVVSFGDFQHRSAEARSKQLGIMGALCEKVAKIRMFGASSIDFAHLAAGRTDAVVVFTRNRWDLAPGLAICREAGALICAPDGGEYTPDSCGVVASASQELADIIIGAFGIN